MRVTEIAPPAWTDSERVAVIGITAPVTYVPLATGDPKFTSVAAVVSIAIGVGMLEADEGPPRLMLARATIVPATGSTFRPLPARSTVEPAV